MRHPSKTGATKIEKAEQRLSVARQVEIRFFGKICWDDQQSIHLQSFELGRLSIGRILYGRRLTHRSCLINM